MHFLVHVNFAWWCWTLGLKFNEIVRFLILAIHQYRSYISFNAILPNPFNPITFVLFTMDSVDCILIFVILLITKYLFQRLIHQNLLPRPVTLPLLGHLHLLKKPIHTTLQSLSLKNGPIIFLKFGFCNVLTVSSPTYVEEIFTTNDINFANCPNFVAGQYLGQNYTALGWAPYGKHYRNLRRIASTKIFSTNRLILSSHLCREEIKCSVKEMFSQTKLDEWKFIDVSSMLFDLTINIMMMIVVGRPCYGENMGIEEKR
ncbi:hypothetical protein IFM89_014072 [Coptis chinensis]|uniref:Cytochrome P450 n=1 Tax=Coptis chinensis TaxID=261450 RepID=A0A835HKE2_9MAGN|nr:hypothetical protein IFM89_014072 [Coptis chinensis]